MTTRPTEYPEWGSDHSNITTPSSGQKATGWTVGQTGVSSYENWKANLTDNWIRYLDERVVGKVRHITATTGSLIVAPSRNRYLPLLSSTDMNPTGPSSAHVHTAHSGDYILAANTTPIYIPVDLDVGDSITNFSLSVNKTSGSACVLHADLIYTNVAAETTTSLTCSNSASAPGVVQMAPGAGTVTLVAGRTYYIKFYMSGTPASGDEIYNCQVTWSSYPTAPRFSGQRWCTRAVGEIFDIPIMVHEGETITKVEAVYAGALAGDSINMKIYRATPVIGGSDYAPGTQLGSTQTGDGSTGFPQLLTVSGLTETVPVGYSFYHVEFETLSLTDPVTGSLWLQGIVVTTTV